MSNPVQINFSNGDVYEDANWTEKGIIESPLPPGSATWRYGMENEIRLLSFVCPCGCRDVVLVPIRQGAGNSWDWNENMDAPTLKPSIFRTVGCRWHGYLTDGKFITA